MAREVLRHSTQGGPVVLFNQFFRGLNRRVILIAIDGGPCAGKTTFMARAKQHLEECGFFVGILSERATEFILAGITPWSSWEDHLDFQRFLLFQGLNMESIYADMLARIAGNKPIVLLCDRGTLGFKAYVSSADAYKVMESLEVDEQLLCDRYKAVIHLVTAADGAEKFFTLENNQARTESLEDARALDKRTLSVWHGHPHHIIIDNSTGFEKKIHRALTAFARVLGMPEPLEKERKFLLTNFHPGMIPAEAVQVEIEQTYLVSTVPDEERRVRKWTVNGATSYLYTRKYPTDELGVRIEREELITYREYREFLSEIDPETNTLHKTRYRFSEHGHNFELDMYDGYDFVTVEVEVDDMSLVIKPPANFEWVEVTGEMQYSNKVLAKK